ncbi:hypothetical protein [uncultured Brachyspira sp.]|nr:hypothetical protein [uncultured Brachyspira sp.]
MKKPLFLIIEKMIKLWLGLAWLGLAWLGLAWLGLQILKSNLLII